MDFPIPIDPEVQEAIARKASQYGFPVYAPDTPNKVLRVEFGIDQPPTQSTPQPKPDNSPAHLSSPPTIGTSAPTNRRSHKRIGPRLLREHRLDCEKGYYSDNGIPYQKPAAFPVVFFDPNGYLVVRDRHSLDTNPHINVGAQVSIPGGISKVPGYVKCEHVHG